MKNSLIAFLSLLSLCQLQSTYAQTINTAKLDTFLDALDKKNLAMGSIAISKNGVLVYQRAIGHSFLDPVKKTANTYTKYKIGSITKVFTAVLIFQLIEEEKLHLNDSLFLFFPDLPNADRITIRQLLNHKSGLSNYTDNTNFHTWMDQPKTKRELLRLITQKEADFEPNAKTVYSNSNYLVLSYIMEQITQKPYDQLLKERIVDKIGLKNTYYGGYSNSKENECLSYANQRGQWILKKETHPSIHSGAGGIVSNPKDLTQFINALFDYKLISKKSVSTMIPNANDMIGAGLWSYRTDKHTGFGKGGKIEGFLAFTYHFPDENLTVVYCTNGYVYRMNDIVNNVIRICHKDPLEIPIFEPIVQNPDSLDQYLGVYNSPMGITVNCTREDSKLILETKGHKFLLEAYGKHLFMDLPNGHFFDFNPAKNVLLIKEGANIYRLTKK